MTGGFRDKFALKQYPGALTVLSTINPKVNNATSFLSTTNEQGYSVAVGVARPGVAGSDVDRGLVGEVFPRVRPDADPSRRPRRGTRQVPRRARSPAAGAASSADRSRSAAATESRAATGARGGVRQTAAQADRSSADRHTRNGDRRRRRCGLVRSATTSTGPRAGRRGLRACALPSAPRRKRRWPCARCRRRGGRARRGFRRRASSHR